MVVQQMPERMPGQMPGQPACDQPGAGPAERGDVSWADDVIWWQLHPISFLGAEPEALLPDAPPVHRIPRLERWLDYLVGLGCNGLALGPVFASGSHGYDTVDHFRVDSRLGDEADLIQLFEACHQRGVRVLLDGVFNHVGRGFGPFREVLAHGAGSPSAQWFRLDPAAGGPDGFGYADFEGHRHLVALNHDSLLVTEHVVAVLRYWLDRGADGWRLDAAYAVPPGFWRDVVTQVRRTHPRAWFAGEVIHGDYSGFISAGRLDSVTQYELWKAIWSSLNDRNFYELAWAFERHDGFARGFRPWIFAGNHDVTRLASRLDDERHLPHALAVLFTAAGIPSVYAGDEQAFRGVKYERADGDSQIRPVFPDGPDGLAPQGWPVYRLHQDLIGLRRRNRWLVRGRARVIHVANEVLAYRVAADDDGPALVVLLNLSGRESSLDLSGPEFPPSQLSAARRLLGSETEGPAERVGPHGWAILDVPGRWMRADAVPRS